MARDFDFKKLVPKQWIRDGGSDFEGFLDDIQSAFNDVLADTDRFTDLISIDDTPDGTDPNQGTTDFVDVLLTHLGNPFDFAFQMATVDKRRLAELLVPLYRQKGTCNGIENAIRVLTGFESQCIVISEGFTPWQLDTSLLGVTTYLYGSESDLWSFEVFVNGTMTQTDRDRITDIINYMKPLEAKLVRLVQGAVADGTLRFDIRGKITVDGLVRYDQTVGVTTTSLMRFDLQV